MDENVDPLPFIQNINPSDWPNIPKLLQTTLICMKKCLITNSIKINEISQKIVQNSAYQDKKYEEIEDASNFLKNMILETDEMAKSRISEFTENLYQEIAAFKRLLTSDSEFKIKSIDTKLNSMQEQFFVLKKTVSSLPFMQEIEKSVKDSAIELKKTLRKDVIDNIVMPEVAEINTKIRDVSENTNIYISKFQELFEVFRNNIHILDTKSNENYNAFEKMVNALENDKQSEFKNIENSIGKLNKQIGLIDLQLKEKNTDFTSFTKKFEKMVQDLNERVCEMNDQLFKKIEEIKSANAAKENFLDKEKKPKKINEKPKIKKSKSKLNKKEEILIKKPEELKTDSKVETKNESKQESKIESKIDSKIENKIEIKFDPIEKISYQHLSIIDKQGLSSLKVPNDDNLSKYSDSTTESSKLKNKLKTIEENLKFLELRILPAQTSLKLEKLELDQVLAEIREKLSWLPMNLNQIKGKPPNEARLFTIEARLRMEENSRVEQFNSL